MTGKSELRKSANSKSQRRLQLRKNHSSFNIKKFNSRNNHSDLIDITIMPMCTHNANNSVIDHNGQMQMREKKLAYREEDHQEP